MSSRIAETVRRALGRCGRAPGRGDRAPGRGRGVGALATLALLCVATFAAAEPPPVGLDAQGVDIRAALGGGLDVRDAFNRPVSRVLVERDWARAAAAVDPSPAVSALPFARALWEAINRVFLGLGLRRGRPSSAPPAAAGLPWRLPRAEPALLAVLAAAFAAAVQSLFLRPAAVLAAPAFSRPLVLRC